MRRLKLKKRWLALFLLIPIIFIANRPKNFEYPKFSILDSAPSCKVGIAGKTANIDRAKGFKEASGLQAGSNNIFWMHGDGTPKKSEQSIWATDINGNFLARYTIPSSLVELSDFEDIAIGSSPVEGTNYLYLGAMGDNDNSRDIKTIVRVTEPAVASEQEYAEYEVDPNTVQALRFRYRRLNGIEKFNSETLFLDPHSGDLFIITKTLDDVDTFKDVAWVFKIPATSFDTGSNDIIYIDPVTAIKGNFRKNTKNGPTGADISSDGLQVAILNNNEIIYYQRSNNDSIVEMFAKGPTCIHDIRTKQNEGITFYNSNDRIYINSELKDTPLNYFVIVTQ